MQLGLSSSIWGESLPGQSNASGDRDALFLKMFGGEIARAYKENLVFMPSVTHFQVRGKAIQLPYFGRASVGYQGSGVNMLVEANGLLTSVRGADRSLYVDKPLVAGVVVDEWDELISHLPTRMIYADELGQAHARAIDNIIARCIVKGANVAADAIFTGHPGGNVYTSTGVAGYDCAGSSSPSASLLATALQNLRIAMDEKNVPLAGRKIAMSPKNYQLICNNKDLFDVQYNAMQGNGQYAQGMIERVYGFEIVQTTNGPFENNTITLPTSTAGGKTKGNYTLALGDNAAGASQVFSGTGYTGSGVANGDSAQAAVTAARQNAQLSTSSSNDYTTNASKLVAIAWAPKAVAVGTARGFKVETDYKTELGGTLLRTSQITGATYWQPEACGAIYNV